MRLSQQQDDVRRRRQLRRLPFGQELRREAIVVVRRQRMKDRMRRKVGLHDHLARQVGATGATGHLRQQRGEPLGRAEIRAVERVVGTENADQRETRKIVSLRQHLCANQHVDRLLGNLRAHRRECVLRSRAVAIDADDACIGKPLRQRALEPLRAKALR